MLSGLRAPTDAKLACPHAHLPELAGGCQKTVGDGDWRRGLGVVEPQAIVSRARNSSTTTLVLRPLLSPTVAAYIFGCSASLPLPSREIDFIAPGEHPYMKAVQSCMRVLEAPTPAPAGRGGAHWVDAFGWQARRRV